MEKIQTAEIIERYNGKERFIVVTAAIILIFVYTGFCVIQYASDIQTDGFCTDDFHRTVGEREQFCDFNETENAWHINKTKLAKAMADVRT